MAWVKMRPNVGESVVSLIPGSYWVRYYERGIDRNLNAAPFTKIEVKDQKVLDFTNLPDKASEAPKADNGKQ